ncbi:MAG: hypothetical protein A2Y86_07610 [Candidatus Aminicenantes bacterium RBG_13_62_12]|nr:MAG: hypothetical protein A2Y86_07610 [Candidatus Aminicenantes bacterium RBG_13_62_12]
MNSPKDGKTSLRSWFAGGAAALVVLLTAGSCRFGIPDYSLTVVIEDGVTGTPEAGRYVHQELTTVEYSYVVLDPAHTVEVVINGVARTIGYGSIVMYGDGYELKARLVDLRGTWKMTLTYDDASISSPGEFTLTLEGADLTSGTFTDSRGASGVWSAYSGYLTLTYNDWFDYVLTGTVFYMQGTFSGEELTGTWTATRQN